MTTPSKEQRYYKPELDALRFCAFTLVFLFHTFPRNQNLALPSSSHHAALSHLCSILLGACGVGLPLFFTLSAFLITSLLLRERELTGTINIRNFYLRRILRIWPLYFLGLLIGITWALTHNQAADLWRFLWFFFFIGNFYCFSHGVGTSPMLPLWSISIEEQFYLFWPWVMKYLSRTKIILLALLMILLANIAIFIASHFLLTATNQPALIEDAPLWCNTLVQFQMFAVGILIALFEKTISQLRRAAVPLLIVGIFAWLTASGVFNFMHSPYLPRSVASNIAAYALIALGCGAVLAAFLQLGSLYAPRWAISLGKISYGLYVYHLLCAMIAYQTMLALFPQKFTYSYHLNLPLAIVLVLLFARLSYRFIERPFLLLKRRFQVIDSKPA